MTPRSTGAERSVAELVDGFFSAMDAGDLTRVAELNAHDPDVVHVGTDRGERWVGWEALRAATEEQLRELDAFRVDVRERRVKPLGSGDVACFFQEMDVLIEGAEGEQRLNAARLTGVAERRRDGWVLVQTHLSLPES